MIKRCEHCQAEFEARRKTKRFCDDKCRKAAWRACRPLTSTRHAKDAKPPVPTTPDVSDMRDMLTQVLKQQNDILRQIKARPIIASGGSGGGGSIPVMSGLAPRDTSADASLDELINVTESTSKIDAGANLVAAMMRLATPAKPAKNSGPKKMDMPQFDAPSFEELPELELQVVQ